VINSNLGRMYLDLSPFSRYGQFFFEFLPPPFNLQFDSVPIALDCWNFAWPCLIHMANYSCKSFPL